jgi:hypothetical protein
MNLPPPTVLGRPSAHGLGPMARRPVGTVACRPAGTVWPMAELTRLAGQAWEVGREAAWSPRCGHARAGTLTEGAAVVKTEFGLHPLVTGDEGKAPGNKRGGGTHQGVLVSVRWRRASGR